MATQQTTECRLIQKCATCGNDLPLRLPRPDEQSREWVCNGCDSVYDAVLNANAAPKLRQNVRPAAIEFDCSKPAQRVDSMLDFLNGLMARTEKTTEKRESQRHPLAVPVLAMPVDEQFRPAGETMMMVSRNISTGGIALLHTHAIEARLLALELSMPNQQKLQLVMEVVRCRPLGPYVDIAGRFVTKMGGTAAGN